MRLCGPFYMEIYALENALRRLCWPHYIRGLQRKMMAGRETTRWWLVPSADDMDRTDLPDLYGGVLT